VRRCLISPSPAALALVLFVHFLKKSDAVSTTPTFSATATQLSAVSHRPSVRSKASDKSVRPTQLRWAAAYAHPPSGRSFVALRLVWRHDRRPSVQGKVKGVGQECPTHTIKPKVKSVGQECRCRSINSRFLDSADDSLCESSCCARNGMWTDLVEAAGQAVKQPRSRLVLSRLGKIVPKK